MTTVISVEHLSKEYRLGQIGTGTLSRDINIWWAKVRGKPNPMLRLGETDHGNRDGETIFALKDVSFTVEQGEALGIIGRNGAGKSTLLKILSRVTAPTSGRVKVKGRIASLLEVGTGFHPDLTGRENIYLNGAILGMTRQEVRRKLDEIVEFAEIKQFLDTPVKRYSSGMYVRLAFAVAAHLDPEILVVDEVLAVGDAEFQKKCLGKMGNVAKEGRTVLFVSHNMVAVNELCGIAILISKGEVCYSGKTGDVINHYLSSIIGSDSDFDRQGNGDIRISEVQLLLNNEIVRHIKLFDTIQILIGIIVNKYVSDCVIGIKILNMSNDIVFATNTELLGIENLNLLSGTENRYTFSIKNMPFKNGIYKLTVGIHPKGKGNKFSEYYDRVQDVITFTMYGDENDHGLVNLYTNFSRL